jgi:hypothetical protein
VLLGLADQSDLDFDVVADDGSDPRRPLAMQGTTRLTHVRQAMTATGSPGRNLGAQGTGDCSCSDGTPSRGAGSWGGGGRGSGWFLRERLPSSELTGECSRSGTGATLVASHWALHPAGGRCRADARPAASRAKRPARVRPHADATACSGSRTTYGERVRHALRGQGGEDVGGPPAPRRTALRLGGPQSTLLHLGTTRKPPSARTTAGDERRAIAVEGLRELADTDERRAGVSIAVKTFQRPEALPGWSPRSALLPDIALHVVDDSEQPPDRSGGITRYWHLPFNSLGPRRDGTSGCATWRPNTFSSATTTCFDPGRISRRCRTLSRRFDLVSSCGWLSPGVDPRYRRYEGRSTSRGTLVHRLGATGHDRRPARLRHRPPVLRRLHRGSTRSVGLAHEGKVDST